MDNDTKIFLACHEEILVSIERSSVLRSRITDVIIGYWLPTVYPGVHFEVTYSLSA